MRISDQRPDILDIAVSAVLDDKELNGISGFISGMFGKLWAIEEEQAPGSSLIS